MIYRSLLWFLLYIAFIYLTTGFVFTTAIPRLIILYVWILSTLYSIVLRVIILRVMNSLYAHGILRRKKILILHSDSITPYTLRHHPSIEYISISNTNPTIAYTMIRERSVDTVLSMLGKGDVESREEIVRLCEIYGVSYAYPKILPHVYELPKVDTFIG